MEMRQHPLSAAFPSMSDDDFIALKADIDRNGQREPIMILEGMVLDGWHRYRACTELGRKPQQFTFTGSDPAAFVVSHNLHRRHLTASQRASAIVSCAEWQPANVKAGVNPVHPTTEGDVTLRGEPSSPQPKAKTNAEMAAEAKVSERTIQQAKVAHKAGLTDAVKEGALTVKEAAKVATGKTAKAKPKKTEEKAEREQQDSSEGAPDDDEIAATIAAERAERESFEKLLAADDKLAAATTEIKRLNYIVATQQQRINGLTNEKAQAIKQVKSWQSKYEKAMKEKA